MTLSPEQFDKIALKEDLQKMEERLVSKEEYNKLYNLVDGIAKNMRDYRDEQAANQGAHDRFNKNFLIIKKELKVEAIDAVPEMR